MFGECLLDSSEGMLQNARLDPGTELGAGLVLSDAMEGREVWGAVVGVAASGMAGECSGERVCSPPGHMGATGFTSQLL